MAEAEVRNNDANNVLTSVASMLHNSGVARVHDVVLRIRAALKVDAARMAELAGNMDGLADAHNRYLAFQREQEQHEKSAKSLMALLGPKGFAEVCLSDKTDTIGNQVEVNPHPTELREQAALWGHVA